MDKRKVLFVCTRNSGRSQMAEELLRAFAPDGFEVESAGMEPAEAVDPLVVQVMAELGLDLSQKKPRSVFDLFRQGRLFDYVIAVCDEGAAAQCPVFPGLAKRWRWPFPDPALVQGGPEEKLAQVRAIRDMIKERVTRPFDQEP